MQRLPKDEFQVQTLEIRRVTRQTSGGRRLRFRALVMVGNRKGKVGIGIAKGGDVSVAINKAIAQARKNLIDVPIVNKTIAFPVTAKVKGAKVLLKPQKEGRGITAGSVVRIACELAGIENINAKVLSKSSNKINLIRATMNAFQQLYANK